MTDDEAFVWAVVGKPGDDTPRLVYADWLDEQNDPRGPYLRAEAAWAKARTKAAEKKLRAAGKKLDPVWVARVSRPPAGVCTPLFAELTTRRVEPDDLAWAASDLKQAIPPQLQALVLNYNPGRLDLPYFFPPANLYVGELPNLDGQDEEEYEIGPDLVERTWWLRQEWDCPDHLLFLAGGVYDEHVVVSAAGDDAGVVYTIEDFTILDDDPDSAVVLAASVGEFLARLVPRSYPLGDTE